MTLTIPNDEINTPATPTNKYKEYRKEWAKQNKDKVNLYANKQYIKRVSTDPEFRMILNERTKARQRRIKEENPTEPKQRGRPKKEKEPVIKKANGRPRKYTAAATDAPLCLTKSETGFIVSLN